MTDITMRNAELEDIVRFIVNQGRGYQLLDTVCKQLGVVITINANGELEISWSPSATKVSQAKVKPLFPDPNSEFIHVQTMDDPAPLMYSGECKVDTKRWPRKPAMLPYELADKYKRQGRSVASINRMLRAVGSDLQDDGSGFLTRRLADVG